MHRGRAMPGGRLPLKTGLALKDQEVFPVDPDTALPLIARHIPLLGVVIVCAYTDLAYGRIFNSVTFGAIVYGLAVATMLGGVNGLTAGLLAIGIALCLFGPVYLMKGIGAGDVKLIAAVGAMCASWRFVLFAGFYSALVGAVIGVGFLIWRGRLLDGLKRSAVLMGTLGRKPAREHLSYEDTFPYGLAIAIGTLWAFHGFVMAASAVGA